MSFGGIFKQLSKVNQRLSETLGSAQPTKLDDVYINMDRDMETMQAFVKSFVEGVNEYLQPNPYTRAKKASVGSLSSVSCTPKKCLYSQTEAILAGTLATFGTRLGESSQLGQALIDVGDTYRMMADLKYQLEDSIKQNVLDPLLHLQSNELKSWNHQRSKLRSRRVEYDCLKRSQRADDSMQKSEEKLEQLKHQTEMAMFNVLSNDVEQVSQLYAMVDAQLEFNRKTTMVLEQLYSKLGNRIKEMSSRPRAEHIPAPVLPCRTAHSLSAFPSNMSLNSKKAATAMSQNSFNIPWKTAENAQPIGMKEDALIDFTEAIPTHVHEMPVSKSMILLDNSFEFVQYPGDDLVSKSQSNEPAPLYPLLEPLSNDPAVPIPVSDSMNDVKTPLPDYSILEELAKAPEPSCKALFDFNSGAEEDLHFKEGDEIALIRQIDENWFEGRLNGKRGLFPSNYVEVLVPIAIPPNNSFN